MLLRTVRYVKLHLVSAFFQILCVFISRDLPESLVEAIRRKPAARYKNQPLPFSGLPHFPCFELALFNVVIQERKWRKEGPSRTPINKQFELTLSQLAVLAHGSCIKTPTARNAAWNEEAKTVRDSWLGDKMRCRIKSQLKSSGGVVGVMTKLRAERSGVRIPVRARNFPLLKNAKAASGINPASYSVCTELFPVGKAAGA